MNREIMKTEPVKVLVEAIDKREAFILVGESGKVISAGTNSTIIALITGMISSIVKVVAKDEGVDNQEIVDSIFNGLKIYNLTETGMTPEEAIEVLGLTNTVSMKKTEMGKQHDNQQK